MASRVDLRFLNQETVFRIELDCSGNDLRTEMSVIADQLPLDLLDLLLGQSTVNSQHG